MELRPGELEGALPARAAFAVDEEWEHLDAPMFYDLEAFGDAAHSRHVSSAFAENAANTQGTSLCSDPLHAPGAIVGEWPEGFLLAHDAPDAPACSP